MPKMPGKDASEAAAGDPAAKARRVRLQAALLLSLAAGAAVWWFLSAVHRPVPVVVAARDIAPNAQITAADVRAATVSAGDRHPKAFSSPEQVVGRTALEPIHEGMQVIAPQVAGQESAPVRPGEVLVPLKNPVAAPDLKAGSTVLVVAVNPEGPLVLGRARLAQYARSLAGEALAVLALPEGDAPRVAAAAVNAKAVYLLAAQ